MANLGAKRETWSLVFSSGYNWDWWSAISILTDVVPWSLNVVATKSFIAVSLLDSIVYCGRFLTNYFYYYNHENFISLNMLFWLICDYLSTCYDQSFNRFIVLELAAAYNLIDFLKYYYYLLLVFSLVKN